MNTVLNSRLMDALESLRAQGKYSFPCTLLREGKSLSALLGPRVDSHMVRLLVDGAKEVAALGVVSVSGETLAALEAEADRLQVREVARQMLNRGVRRDIGGRYAGHSCELAGRA